jgi:hypothetical protein
VEAEKRVCRSQVQLTEADDDWLRASRLKRAGDPDSLTELARMESNLMAYLEEETNDR